MIEWSKYTQDGRVILKPLFEDIGLCWRGARKSLKRSDIVSTTAIDVGGREFLSLTLEETELFLLSISVNHVSKQGRSCLAEIRRWIADRYTSV